MQSVAQYMKRVFDAAFAQQEYEAGELERWEDDGGDQRYTQNKIPLWWGVTGRRGQYSFRG